MIFCHHSVVAGTQQSTRWCCLTYFWVGNYKGHPASQEESGEYDGGHVFEHSVHRGLWTHSASTGTRFFDRCFLQRRWAIVHTTIIHLLQHGGKNRVRKAAQMIWYLKNPLNKICHTAHTSSTFLSVVGGMTLPWLRGKLSGNFARILVWASGGVSWWP